MIPVAEDTAVNPEDWNRESVREQRNEANRKALDPDPLDEILDGAEKERGPIPSRDEATLVCLKAPIRLLRFHRYVDLGRADIIPRIERPHRLAFICDALGP